MSYLKEHFFSEVLQNIMSKEVREAVCKELDQHINSTKQSLTEKGLKEIEAEKLAIKQMGDASELGIKFKNLYRPLFDWKLFGVFFVIIVMGILPVIHAPGDFLTKRIIITVLGIATVIGITLFDYRILYKWKWLVFLVACILMLWVIFLPNVTINGRGYLLIGGVLINALTVMPLFILFWASYFVKKTINNIYTFLLFLLTISLFILNMDFVPLVLFCIVWSVLLIISNTKTKSKIFLMLTFLLSMFLYFTMSFNTYELERFKTILDFQRNGDTYITTYLRDLLANAGWFGNSRMPENFMELHTDMAFVNITYFFGWVVSVFLLLCIIVLLVRLSFITLNIKDEFGKLLVAGIVTILISQFVYNILMMLGLVPYISMSLPFISYGFGPTVINSILIGLVLSIYRRKNLIKGK
ncbi:FtsW/RodA/SpoVE family cell cycle protein [Mangrovibacillus cuniculi]|uniref:FtsW/RodA/SpoVE family cell cycle protein n=1 Tax=Mangrovibacillus cuniculi TaxID=2593652 RepID=A0A7S8CDB3_9BACI|nr:FtsW/RodA/SpoVE family cell cycle protein [Mangrovibacillus cuniculi]QPC47875.1 FtsW/RodA/SpoVE family cell cycle protein [Mangrovibacillus cuniculi]